MEKTNFRSLTELSLSIKAKLGGFSPLEISKSCHIIKTSKKHTKHAKKGEKKGHMKTKKMCQKWQKGRKGTKTGKNTKNQQWKTGNFLVSAVEDIETLSYMNRTPTVKAKAVSCVLFLGIAGFMKAAA